MLLGGDEFRRTQMGNNNAYCQDNELSWYDWALADKNADMVRFFASMVAFRKRFPTLRRDDFYSGKVNGHGVPEIAWHGCRLGEAGWNDPMCRVLSFTLGALDDEPDLHVMLNMYDLGLDFELPVFAGRGWARAIDTAKPSPTDILEPGQEAPVEDPTYHVFGRSAVVLVSERRGGMAKP
jgi:glycogen operon protein